MKSWLVTWYIVSPLTFSDDHLMTSRLFLKVFSHDANNQDGVFRRSSNVSTNWANDAQTWSGGSASVRPSSPARYLPVFTARGDDQR